MDSPIQLCIIITYLGIVFQGVYIQISHPLFVSNIQISECDNALNLFMKVLNIAVPSILAIRHCKNATAPKSSDAVAKALLFDIVVFLYPLVHISLLAACCAVGIIYKDDRSVY